MSPDYTEFRKLEEEGWERVAGIYDSVWSSLTTLFVQPLLIAAGVGKGMKVLDVACGPGHCAVASTKMGAEATGLDFSPGMIQTAKSKHPDIRFEVGDAEQLQFKDETWDCVLINFGLMHLAHPEKALREAKRVLHTSGRIAFTVWAPPEVNTMGKIMDDAIAKHADKTARLPQSPPYFIFKDELACKDVVAGLGFKGPTVKVQLHSVRWVVAHAGFLYEAERDAGVRTAAILASQAAQVQDKIRNDVEAAAGKYSTSGGYALPVAAYIVSAAK